MDAHCRRPTWRRQSVGAVVCLYLMIALAALVASVDVLSAATIRKSQSANCVIEISGEIAKGDFEAFVALSKLLFPPFNGESTSPHTVCLDSPGGSLTEGVKFARHFFKEGVGTVIDQGQECYSACAIMFMMGYATGAEVIFINRKLHINGLLGFHRPYLEIQSSDKVEASTLSLAYDAALQSALDLIAVANSRGPLSSSAMMKSDLIQAMLEHVGNEMFMIDTVDKAGRWEIELLGFEYPTALTEETAFYACENALQWQIGTTESDITYARLVAQEGFQRVKRIESKAGTVAFNVTGLAAGYAGEGRIISSDGEELRGCGVDEYTQVMIGAGPCAPSDFGENSLWLNRLVMLNPATKIAALADQKPAQATARGSRCFVFRDGVKVDDEPCTVKRVFAGTPYNDEVTEFLWPSGGKTVLVRRGQQFELNGFETTQEESPEFGRCYLNRQSGNRFCVVE